MAVKTGTALKAEASAADAALNAAISTPSEANIQAAVNAFNAVVAHSRDSRFVTTTAGQRLHKDLAVLAAAASRDLTTILSKGGTDAEQRSALRLLRRQLDAGLWRATLDKPTTT